MNTEITCPICKKKFSSRDICPTCGLTGLDELSQIISMYNKWMKEKLEPHIEKNTIHVSAGKSHALIIKNGTLYGIGDNCSGQIGNFDKNTITEPCLIANHIATAAAGCNYSIYMTDSGNVRLIGNGEYADRFNDFGYASDVDADKYKNIFSIKTGGKWLFWGENVNIEKTKQEYIYQYPSKEYKGSFYNSGFTEGPAKALEKSGVGLLYYISDNAIKNDIQHSEKYRYFCKLYGSENISINVNRIGELEYSKDSFEFSTKFAPNIVLTNNRIYNPTECEHKPFIPKADTTPNISSDVKKTICINALTYILKRNGELYVVDKEKEILISNCVCDISITNEIIIISKIDGCILYGEHTEAEYFKNDYDLNHLKSFKV